MDKNLLEEENTFLKKEVKRQEKHIQELQESVGRWKRKVKEINPKPEFIREAVDENGKHIIEFTLESLPGDAPYREMLNHVRTEVLPFQFPYLFRSAYYSTKYKTWVVKLFRKLDIEMSYVPDDPVEALRKIDLDICITLNSWIKWIEMFEEDLGKSSEKSVKEIKSYLVNFQDYLSENPLFK